MANLTAELVRAVRATAAGEPALSDRELLRRFAGSADQDAFAALAARHAAMVLGVCRRVLHSPSDAEDACQAVFLILAQKARVVRWQASAANWLHATACRVAANARVAAARRVKREEAAAVPESVPPGDPAACRELVAALDEELDRLPPRYREPLVLCYLEGLTRDEAAARLGMPLSTLIKQLERGRRKLADALTARGCGLGVALLVTATAATRVAARAVLNSVLTAVGGAPSPAAIALAQGASVSGSLVRSKWATATLVAAFGGAMLAGLGFGPGPGSAGPQQMVVGAEKPGAPDRPPDAPKAEVKGRTFTGTVVDADGKPVRAELLVLPRGGDLRPAGRSDEKGAFAVTMPEVEVRGIAHLLVRADGHGVDGVTVWQKTPGELRFVLPKEFTLRGRVIDLQGQPVAGATLTPLAFTAAAAERVDEFVKVWSRMHPQETAFHQVRELPDCTFAPAPLLSATADKDGRFELAGVGAERVVEFLVRGPGVADAHAFVVTRTGFDPDPVNRAAVKARGQFMLAPNGPVLSPARMFGPAPTFALEPEKPVRGVVTDAATGKPRAGVRVTFRRLGEKGFELPHPHRAVTDKEGRFVLRGCGRHPTYLVEADADPQAGYKAARVTATDTDGLTPVEVTLATEQVPK